jgi:hypothetical protein
MSRLKSLGVWLRANPVRPFVLVGALLLLNIISANLLPETAAVMASGIILVAILVLGAAYVLGGRS